ncbi:OTU-domain-containing protein [Delitschia confertaspora ATCC 74209]|uniref:Ubiquitin thioesterase OTU n=1 Tax=Delitschia confertaspora ATCC 74209 TaxID=1513339 RepID=A0A9P4N1S0_9PLEO|nr:OTU-domain-containing protein [Delitschia confertaspora ATCC 74209]
MTIRIRLRAPSGMHTISIPDDAAVSVLLTTISETTSLPLFDLKWGFPPQPLDPSLYGLSTPLKDTDLNLNGAQIIVIDKTSGDEGFQAATTSAQSSNAASQPSHPSGAAAPLSLSRKPQPAEKDTPEIPLPTHGGTLVLRVMPDDNSCMFRAVGTALLTSELDSMTELRSLVAQAIQRDPEMYNEAILQRAPDEYCKWIQYSDSWGGGIELSILSQEFGVEIASINVQDLRVDRFNEGCEKRIILVYSGIHYDTIALSPDGASSLDSEHDIKLFDAKDDVLLDAARQLCGELRKAHYYTDTAKFNIKCNLCAWKGAGEKSAVEHAEQTGHSDFGEAD